MRGNRIRRVRRTGGRRPRALTAPAAPGALLGLQRGAEGLVAVVGVQSPGLGLILLRAPAAGTAHRPQDAGGQVLSACGRIVLLVGGTATLRQLLSQLRNGTAGDHQSGEGDEQDEQDDGGHRGEQHCQRISDGPAEQPAGLLQRGDAQRQGQGGVAGGHLDDARHSCEHTERADADARMDRSQTADSQHGDAQRPQQKRNNDPQDADRTGGHMVQHAPGHTGDAEPLAQAGDDGQGEDDERPPGTAVAASGWRRFDRLRGLPRGAPAGAPTTGASRGCGRSGHGARNAIEPTRPEEHATPLR